VDSAFLLSHPHHHILSQVDRGINPETYTELITNSALERTARTRGRVLALEVFRDAIGAEMQRTMPELWKQFQEQRMVQ
jgi:hypothetical protein